IQLTDDITDGKQVYALRVKGLSMIDALIDDGDIVLMQPANTADNGDMVAVWLKERQEVTLKKIYREPGKIRLQPANSQMTPIYVDPNEIDVQGKVVGVIRKM
ncbi:MAG: repressor LexA, partial [Chloroflexi bacterium]|nr:repressor LexA [Chloroflexota bacterium]